MDINNNPITVEEKAIYETENNKAFVNKVVNIDSSIIKTFDYIKENFNINPEYNEETGDITLNPVVQEGQVCESQNLLNAKDYILIMISLRMYFYKNIIKYKI